MSGQLIGRFEILRELGKGGQGAVYLARDPQLDRQVAIKTLRKSGHDTEQLTNEARIVSKLQHSNIIALYDSDEHKGTPYLVYAYVEGKTLAQLLKEKKTLSFVQAAEIACGVLEGLAYAHSQGVAHLDVKPANVMITNTGIPMVMDFGLAKADSGPVQAQDFIPSGTPRYVAPEMISGQSGDYLADIYSAGTMLYEMVTGKFAVNGNEIYEILNRVAHDKIAAPSTQNDRVDEKLESIILKAVSKNPDERYPSASDMRQALQEYLGEAGEAVNAQRGGDHSTLEFLLRRMRNKKDFPALSASISEINRIVSSESTSSSKLASVILQDFALTTKLLKLVNAAAYGRFGGTINTISKAVVILGFETVRSIAASLILIEFLQNKPQAAQLKDEIINAILSSVVAAKLSVGHNIRDVEEVMVCSMFHNLGRMLSTYYFFDESQQILRLMEQRESEENAAIKVLGISTSELGLGVAHSWNFSPRLIAGMRKLDKENIRPANTELEQLSLRVNLANDLCEIAASSDIQDKQQSLRDLAKQYGNATKISEKDLSAALDTGLNEITTRSVMLGISTGKSPLLDKVREWNKKLPDTDSAKPASGLTKPASGTAKHEAYMDGITRLDQTLIQKDEATDSGSRPANPEAVLGAGIQDVTTSLVSDFNLNDVLQMILETIYRGMGFNRALILIRDNRQNAMVARFGFGAGIDAIIPRFRFSLTFVPDVFHLAVAKGLDIAIEDFNAPNIADKIPAWYRSTINAPCFMLLPVTVKEKTICLFYADMLEANSLNTSQQQLSLLRTLRNQAVLAIKQKA